MTRATSSTARCPWRRADAGTASAAEARGPKERTLPPSPHSPGEPPVSDGRISPSPTASGGWRRREEREPIAVVRPDAYVAQAGAGEARGGVWWRNGALVPLTAAQFDAELRQFRAVAPPDEVRSDDTRGGRFAVPERASAKRARVGEAGA